MPRSDDDRTRSAFLSRRGLLLRLAQAGGAAALVRAGGVAGCGSDAPKSRTPALDPTPMELETRALGRMGFRASLLGLGGVFITEGDFQNGVATLDRAHELGITYYDTAPNYGDGESERRFGSLIERLEREGRRSEVFLATKTDRRDRDGAARQIESSLGRLRTGYIDLLQLHNVYDSSIWQEVSGPSGALRAVEEARADGRVRHVGVSGHDPALLMRAVAEYPFESVLTPLGVAERVGESALRELLALPSQAGTAVVAMKVFAAGYLRGVGIGLEPCLRYTLTLPVSTAIVGMASSEEVEQNVAWARAFSPMTEEEMTRFADEVGGIVTPGALPWKNLASTKGHW